MMRLKSRSSLGPGVGDVLLLLIHLLAGLRSGPSNSASSARVTIPGPRLNRLKKTQIIGPSRDRR